MKEKMAQTHKGNKSEVSEACTDLQHGKTLHSSPGKIAPQAKVPVLAVCLLCSRSPR